MLIGKKIWCCLFQLCKDSVFSEMTEAKAVAEWRPAVPAVKMYLLDLEEREQGT